MNELPVASITGSRAVEHVGDRERHAGLHPHAPQALLAVAQRRVEELNVGQLLLLRVHAPELALSTFPAELRGSSSTTRYSRGRL
jgi:hypothetical protein